MRKHYFRFDRIQELRMMKKFFLFMIFLLLISRVFADSFSDRFLNKKWILEYYNEIIYYEDRDILLNYIPKYKNQKDILFPSPKTKQ